MLSEMALFHPNWIHLPADFWCIITTTVRGFWCINVSFVSSCSAYTFLKFMMMWTLVLLADFILEFRLEYLWPCWLFFGSVYTTFHCHGLVRTLQPVGLLSIRMPQNNRVENESYDMNKEFLWVKQKNIINPLEHNGMFYIVLVIEVFIHLPQKSVTRQFSRFPGNLCF